MPPSGLAFLALILAPSLQARFLALDVFRAPLSPLQPSHPSVHRNVPVLACNQWLSNYTDGVLHATTRRHVLETPFAIGVRTHYSLEKPVQHTTRIARIVRSWRQGSNINIHPSLIVCVTTPDPDPEVAQENSFSPASGAS
ncbi:hypothetical protein BJY01DRAFT_229590 [Aspergillus pseudoustus]|uniref:Secreted protein n=1 Tax=Aspergillus pseudoustus TaxID=1810923 RepID=A0ABR4IGL8_9EURO